VAGPAVLPVVYYAAIGRGRRPQPSGGGPSMSESNKEIVRKIQEAWIRNPDELDQYFAPDFVARSNVPGMPPGLAGAKAANQVFSSFFTERRAEILDLIAEGDRVVMRNRVTGINSKGVPWLGAESNGSPYDFESWSIYTLRDGKVVEHVGITDTYLFAVQTGAIKPPVPA
jgi:ketosteroid isomerase-like protein